jgi:capreomycidine synthase
MVTHGSTEGIFLALSAIIREGDEIVVPRPVYASLEAVADTLGARLKVWDLDSRDGFRPDIDRLRAIMTPRTCAVVVNFPHNPTGVTLDAHGYAQLLDLVAEHGCYLLWDAAFSELVYDQPALPDPTTRYDRAISTGTLSKAYGLPGLRVGWCIGPSAVLDRMVHLRDYVTLNTSPLTELLAAIVVERGDEVAGPRREQARVNRRLLTKWAAAHSASVDYVEPVGGVSAFPRFTELPSVDELAIRLADEHGVLVVPGSCFGYPDRMRIGFGCPTDELAAGLAVLGELITR